jgi:hypothetical protein
VIGSAVLGLALLAAPAPAPAPIEEEAKFVASAEVFADAAACRGHLERTVSGSTAGGYAAARGPYEVTGGDVRVHLVRAEGAGHRIWEHRCLDKALSSRTWTHSMEGEEEAFTVESAARTAEWLKKDVPKQ